jgi:hypothetical protein
MSLIAATAIGLAIVKVFAEESLPSDTWDPNVPWLSRKMDLVWAYILVTLPCPTMWALTLLILRLRRPRPDLRQIARQPGVTACGAVALTLLVRTIGLLIVGFRTGFDLTNTNLIVSWQSWVRMYSTMPMGAEMTIAVAVAWVTLSLTGCWCPEPTWVDRAGRLLGVYWLAIMPFSCWAIDFLPQ